MHTIRTLGDLFHDATNALSLISSHAQYLLGKDGVTADGKEDLEVIRFAAERTAALLALLPRELLRTPIPATSLLTPNPIAKSGDDGKGGR